MNVIEVEGLHKAYRRLRGGKTIALRGLDMAVPEGGVFGFLGPNGSGKTTTIRCLLGLIRPTAGTTRLLGAEPRALAGVITKVGSLVEAPAFFPNFSGRRNLRLLGAIDGIGTGAVDKVLDRVGLAERGSDLFKTYSLGMKQRLAIAAALLKDPSLIILDEPANGLDPAGIREVRELLRSLGKEGRTVFLSSHLLAEVEQICDRVAIISKGGLISTGDVADVLSAGRNQEMIVGAADLDKALQTLTAAGYTATLAGDRVRVTVDHVDAEKITRALVAKRVYPTELRPVEVNLETVFLTLTGEETVPCTSCGSPMRTTAKFCTTCGAPAGAAPETEATQ